MCGITIAISCPGPPPCEQTIRRRYGHRAWRWLTWKEYFKALFDALGALGKGR